MSEQHLSCLGRAIARVVEYFTQRRLHESLQNATPANVNAGRQVAILERRARTKRATRRGANGRICARHDDDDEPAQVWKSNAQSPATRGAAP